jgi:hypothetical protein
MAGQALPYRLARRQRVLAGLLGAHTAVMLAYWVATDLPRAQEANRHWPAVEQFAQMIGRDPAPVVALSVPEPTSAALQVTLDRSVGTCGPEGIPAHAVWLISDATAAIGPEFAPQGTCEDLRLWRRVESAPLTRTAELPSQSR